MTDSAASAPEFNDEPALECSVPEPVLWVNFKALDLYPGDPPIIAEADRVTFATQNRTALVTHELGSIEELDKALDTVWHYLNEGENVTFVLKNTSPLAPAIVNSLNRNHPELGLSYLQV